MSHISGSISGRSHFDHILSIAVLVAMLGALFISSPGMADTGTDPIINLSSKDAPPCDDDQDASCVSKLFTVDFTHTASYEFDCHGTPVHIPWFKGLAALLGIEIPWWVPDPTPDSAICTYLAQGSTFKVYESGNPNPIVDKMYTGWKHKDNFTVQPNHTYRLELNGHGRDFREILEANTDLTFDSFAEVTYQELDPPDETCQNPFPIDNLPYSGNLEFSGDHDWQKIKSPVKGTMVLTLDVPPDKDYQLEVWNDACSAIWVLSQNGTGVDEQFVMPVDPVYYRVHVFGKTLADFGAWYSVSALWDLDDNQWENAAFFDTPFQGNLEYSGDQDWQKITVPAGGTTLVLDIPEGKNYELELWRDDVKTKLAESKNGVGMDEFIPITQPGTYRIHIYGVNPATDFNASYGVSLIVDNVAPVSTITLSGTMGNNGWYRSNVQVTLSATDNPGGSGVQKIEYGFNYTPETPFSGPWNIYTGPFAVSTEGSTHLVYRSTDNAGNVEANKTQLIKIDKTPPTINIITPQAKDYLHSASFDIVWSANDSFSGVETSSATLDSQPVANGQTIDLFLLSLGSHTVTLQANDKAGNSASMSVIFNVTADINSLLAVTQHAYDLGWIEKQGVYNSLNASLKVAQASIERNQLNAARNQLMALLNKLDAQKGKAINQQAYDLLKADIMYLLEHLSQP